MPRVSVVMPCYSSERYLAEAIDSVLSQSLDDLELIVVLDAGSKDGTEAVLDGYSDERMRVVRNDPPLGLVRSLNRGFALARGEYVARMDADDIALPERLERQAAFLGAEPSVGIVGSAVQVIDADGRNLGVRHYPTSPGLTLWRMHFDCAMCHPATMFRKKVFDDTGGYSPRARNGEDYDLWLRAMRYHNITNMPEVLLRYRLHGDSISSRKRDEQRKLMVDKAGRAIDLTLGRPVDREFVRSLIFPVHHRQQEGRHRGGLAPGRPEKILHGMVQGPHLGGHCAGQAGGSAQDVPHPGPFDESVSVRNADDRVARLPLRSRGGAEVRRPAGPTEQGRPVQRPVQSWHGAGR